MSAPVLRPVVLDAVDARALAESCRALLDLADRPATGRRRPASPTRGVTTAPGVAP